MSGIVGVARLEVQPVTYNPSWTLDALARIADDQGDDGYGYADAERGRTCEACGGRGWQRHGLRRRKWTCRSCSGLGHWLPAPTERVVDGPSV